MSFDVNRRGRIDMCQYGVEVMTMTDVAAPDALCCIRPGSAPLARSDADALAATLKAVADPVRLQIISALRCADGMSLCACDIAPALDVSQPTMSHHLKILTEAGILTRERKGSWAWFTLVPARLEEIAAALRVD